MRPIRIERLFTDRDQDSLQRYFNDLHDIDMISVEEEVHLSERILSGDERAVERLVKANLRFVITVAKKYTNSGIALADLINEGNVGLIRAARSFDATKGFKFISFAVWWIRQAILLYIGDSKRMVRIPMNQIRSMQIAWTAANRLEQQLERKPTTEEIAVETGFSQRLIIEQFGFEEPVKSLDAPLSDGENFALGDLFFDGGDFADQDFLFNDFKAETHRLLATLEEREQHILRAMFGIDGDIPMSLDDLSAFHGVSRERIRHISRGALSKLKSRVSTSMLEYV